MVNHELVLNVGDSLTVTVADPNDRSTTAPRNSFSNYNTNAPPALFETAPRNNSGNKVDKVYKNVGGRRKTRKAGGKRGANGFMKFAKEKRPEVMSENPGIAFGDVGRRLGEKWRALSAVEKARY